MNDMLRPHLDDFATIYLDDILVFSRSQEEHAEHVRIILQILREHNFKAKRKKCVFNMARVTYLGHVIDSDGVHMDPAKVEAVANWPTPTSGADLRPFLGLAGYMRRYIKGFAKITSCLQELTKLNTKWSWTSEHQKQF